MPGTGGAGGGDGGSGGKIAVVDKCDLPADAAPQDQLTLEMSAQGPKFIEILDIVQAHPVVYGCTSVKGLTVWDAQTGQNLVTAIAPPGLAGVGKNSLPHCQHVVVDESKTRVAMTNRGDEIQPQPFVYVFDVSDPASPKALNGWTGSESIEGITWVGDTIYAAAHSAGVLSFKVSGDGSLTKTSSFSDGASDAWQVQAHGKYLLTAEGAQGLRVYAAEQGVLSLVAELPLKGSSKDIVIKDDVAYVASSSYISVVDIRQPTAPKLLSETETTGTAVALAVGHNHTLVVAEWNKLIGYDISDPYAVKREFSEVIPSTAAYSRILSVAADPERQRVYAGEWSGLHYYRQEDCGVGPDIEVAPSHLSFPTLPMGESETQALKIVNYGNRDLKVASVETNSALVSFDNAAFELAPGNEHELAVTFSPTNSEPLNAGLRLASNDLDDSPLRLSISGNVVGVGEGDPLPSFSLLDTEGNMYSSEMLKGQVVLLAYFATF